MRWLAVVVGIALAGCVAAVDFDAFRGGDAGAASTEGGAVVGGDAGSQSSPGSSGDGGGGIDAGADASVIFADTFDRADGEVSNGWSQFTADSYEIESEQLKLTAQGYQYDQAWMYQPATSQADLTVSVEFTVLDQPSAVEQVHARAIVSQTTPRLQTYGAAIQDDGDLFVFRGTEQSVNFLKDAPLAHNLKVGERYRITLSVVGADPVKLKGVAEHFNGGAWLLLASVATADGSNDQLKNAGRFGLSADGNPNITYDNFLATVATP